MVNINEEFPSKYLKAADLAGNVAKVQIAHIGKEEIGKDKDERLVLYFRGKQKGMVLNKTNAFALAEAFGGETDDWTGADIEVFSMKVEYQGRMVDGLRIRIPPQKKPNGNSAPAASAFVGNARDDSRVANPPAPPARQTLAEELDDEIPF